VIVDEDDKTLLDYIPWRFDAAHWKGLDTLKVPVELYVQRRKKCCKIDEFRMATCEMCSLHIATADQTFDTLNLSFLAYNKT
jgi:hypothetical protein